MSKYRIAIADDLRYGTVFDILDPRGNWLCWSMTIEGAMRFLRHHLRRI